MISLAQVFFKRENSTIEEKIEILRKLEGQTIRNSERILATIATLPNPAKEVVRHIDENTSELRVPLSSKAMENFLRLKELWKLDSFQEVLAKMLEQTLAKVDPVKIARRNASAAKEVKITHTRYIPAQIRHAVWLRDEGRCTFTADNKICRSTYDLQIHHEIPYAKGGKHTEENLRLLCFAHNQLLAREEFPHSAEFSRSKPAEGGASSGPP